MSITNYPNGVSSFGMPLIGMTTGNVWFVHSSGSNGNSGTDADNPFADIDYAIGRCTADKGDIIFVMPGHTETLTAAGAIDCDVAGISIIGLGTNRSRPTISVSTTAGVDIDIDAENIVIDNLVFDLTGVDAVAAFFDVNQSDFTLQNCEVIMADTGGQAVHAVEGGAARAHILNNQFLAPVTAGAENAIEFVNACDDWRVIGNVIDGNFSEGCIFTSDTPLRLLIKDNQLTNISAGDAAIVLGATSVGVTGMICNNMISVADSTGITAQRVTQLGQATWFENYIANSTAAFAKEAAVLAPLATYGS